MFGLSDIAGILNLLERFLTFGRSDITGVQEETEELIRDISRSLVSLYDVVTEVTRLKVEEFNEEAFTEIYNYFYRFYLNPEDIDKARTHCSILKRNVGRITYKFALVSHTNIGKWNDVSMNIMSSQDLDEEILRDYNRSIDTLKEQLDEIQSKLVEGDFTAGSDVYRRLKDDLHSDIEQLRTGVSKMKEVAAHVREISG
jgi:hypothetical protein